MRDWPGAGLVRQTAGGLAAALALALAAPVLAAPVLAAPVLAPPILANAPPAAGWPAASAELPIEPGYRLTVLPNGLRVAVRRNANPAGTVALRLLVEAGALDEADDERGYAHFVEHMAFQGSTHVAPGDMIRQLERLGLAFGADTNATTNYEATEYRLDLPQNDAARIDTALLLLRETASELTFPAGPLEHERGVVLAERRERDNWALRTAIDRQAALLPGARVNQRLPIGTPETLAAATPARLRAFWQRHYQPGRMVLIVAGDIDPAAVEAAVARHFADWTAGSAAPPRGTPGPIVVDPPATTSVYLDPALSETVLVQRNGTWQDEPDTIANRRVQRLRALGYAMINRRLQRRTLEATPPFLSAQFGSSDVFRDGRSTTLSVGSAQGKWRGALGAAMLELRRAMAQGFTKAELDEVLANTRSRLEDAASGADARHHGLFVNAIELLAHDGIVPTAPQFALDQFRATAAAITPEMVLAALKQEALALDDPAHPPLLRFEGRAAPGGGTAELRATWNAALAAPLGTSTAIDFGTFAYTQFGPAGKVVADRREPLLGIRELRFANGVQLNLKHTGIDRDRVLVSYAIDGGALLDTRTAPLATAMSAALIAGGLGKHSIDALQSLMAGHAVRPAFAAGADRFTGTAQTTPRDLTLQLQLFTALVSDPGYRFEGERIYGDIIRQIFRMRHATPSSALGSELGGLISDGDPRFTLQSEAAFRALHFSTLKAAISPQLAHGALEIGIVGDVDEDAAIAAVASTSGALPAREAAFRPWTEARQRSFTADRKPRIIYHTGPADQALLALVWHSRDDADPREKQVLNLLERVVRIRLNEVLREKLGKSYAPQATSAPSAVWPGFGTFGVLAEAAPAELPAVRAAILAAIDELARHPPAADLVARAREPLLQSFDNQLKSDAGWLPLVTAAQSRPDRLERETHARARLLAVTASDLQAAVRRYLVPERLLDVEVQPAPTKPAAQPAAPSSPAATPAGG